MNTTLLPVPNRLLDHIKEWAQEEREYCADLIGQSSQAAELLPLYDKLLVNITHITQIQEAESVRDQLVKTYTDPYDALAAVNRLQALEGTIAIAKKHFTGDHHAQAMSDMRAEMYTAIGFLSQSQ
jgi:hypothetical protein